MTTTKASPISELPVIEIEATAATQTRHSVNENVVNEYAEAMLAGSIFPPIVVFAQKGSERFLLADGFHRLAAAKKVGHETISAVTKQGGVREALERALGSNDDHGLRRTDKDKRNAVSMALKDPEWVQWNNVEISRLCRVSENLVRKMRRDLALAGEIDDPDVRKETRKGKTVERKAGKPKEEDNTAPPAKRSQDDANFADFKEAIDAIKLIPHDGVEGMSRWKMQDMLSDLEYARDWITEAIEAGAEQDQAA